MTLLIRPALLDDLPAIVALLADDKLGAAREDLSQPLNPGYAAAFAAIQASPDQTLVVAEDERGRVVGTLQLILLAGIGRQGAWRGIIEGVRIASDRRSEGLGAQLVEWAVQICRERGCQAVQLTTDVSRLDAHRFYERLGFKLSHKGYKMILK
jgi:GNAT superfamily N-acetyltransferase